MQVLGWLMDTREAKAIELADRGRVVRQDSGWLVFSLNSLNRYRHSHVGAEGHLRLRRF